MNANNIHWLDNDDHLDQDEKLPDNVLDEEPEGGFVPLGMAGPLTVVFSKIQKRVFKLKAAELRGLSLEVVLGTAWVKYRLAQLESPDAGDAGLLGKNPAERLSSSIVKACQEVGPYVEALERKAGVWMDSDGELLVSGNELWRPSDGSVMPHGIQGGYVYPAVKCSGFDLHTPMARPEEVQRVLEAFRSFEWSTPMAAEIVLGWLGIAFIATAAHRRPHILVTGPAGCGKSTLIEQVALLLGDKAAAVTGAPTLVGLNQLLRDRACSAVVIDEFEADGRSTRSKQTFEVARSAYSLQEGDAGLVHGSPTGTAVSYRIAAPFLAAGISPGRLEPADQSRWLILEALRLSPAKRSQGALLADDEAAVLGQRLGRLFVGRWASFQANLAVVRAAIRAGGGDARLSDTLGYPLAAYSTFLRPEVITAGEADQLVAAAEVAERAESQVVHDEVECLTRILTYVTTFELREGLQEVKRRLSIGQALKRVVADVSTTESIASRLAQLGIRVRLTAEGWVVMVANSSSHAELRKVFSSSKWSSGGWPIVLNRLPGGAQSVQRLGQGMPSCRVTLFHLPAELMPTHLRLAA
ncbi:MAG: hypothetical protein GXC94_13085 [Comamonadaceae bacterium]|nr:hypothetical protein [Comamonadaceae bacterium]